MSERKRLRVVVVTTQKKWHGGEEQASLLTRGLVGRGFDCRVLARRESAFAERMARIGLPVATFPGRGRSPRTMWRTRQLLNQWQPDVIYMNDPHAVTAAGLPSMGLGTPLRVAARRVDFPLRSAARYRRACDMILCVSEAVRTVCAESGLEETQLELVHDGVDPKRTAPASREPTRKSLGLSADDQLLLTVARLADHKGHRYLLEAMPEILRHSPNVVWALAGDGEEWESLRARTHQLGLEKHVRFLGHRSDVPNLLAAADFKLVPSHLEGLCSSIIDAMLAQLPVIATTAGGIPDLLGRRRHERECGWLVPPRESGALAKGVIDAMRFPHLTSRYTHAAYARAVAEFTSDKMIERTAELFERHTRRHDLKPAG